METSSTAETVLHRSYLYVPGDRADHLEKARDRGADALILDLEDAVSAEKKSMARAAISKWLIDQSNEVPAIWVRINAEALEEDILAISALLEGVMVPRAEPQALARIDQLLSSRELALGLPNGVVKVMPLIETARGLLAAVELASAPRTLRLAIGRADLAGELGLSIDPEGVEFRSLLLQLVVASSAAGIAAPVAPTSTDFRDLDALRASTEALMALGFRGRTAVHPAQLDVINDVFTPTLDEVLRAQRLIAAFEEAARSGSGVTTDEQGRMVDAAVVRSARDVLARARTETPRA